MGCWTWLPVHFKGFQFGFTGSENLISCFLGVLWRFLENPFGLALRRGVTSEAAICCVLFLHSIVQMLTSLLVLCCAQLFIISLYIQSLHKMLSKYVWLFWGGAFSVSDLFHDWPLHLSRVESMVRSRFEKKTVCKCNFASDLREFQFILCFFPLFLSLPLPLFICWSWCCFLGSSTPLPVLWPFSFCWFMLPWTWHASLSNGPLHPISGKTTLQICIQLKCSNPPLSNMRLYVLAIALSHRSHFDNKGNP